nr:collagen alpha-1(I) chain-like [Chelonoidis abingdonii]
MERQLRRLGSALPVPPAFRTDPLQPPEPSPSLGRAPVQPEAPLICACPSHPPAARPPGSLPRHEPLSGTDAAKLCSDSVPGRSPVIPQPGPGSCPSLQPGPCAPPSLPGTAAARASPRLHRPPSARENSAQLQNPSQPVRGAPGRLAAAPGELARGGLAPGHPQRVLALQQGHRRGPDSSSQGEPSPGRCGLGPARTTGFTPAASLPSPCHGPRGEPQAGGAGLGDPEPLPRAVPKVPFCLRVPSRDNLATARGRRGAHGRLLPGLVPSLRPESCAQRLQAPRAVSVRAQAAPAIAWRAAEAQLPGRGESPWCSRGRGGLGQGSSWPLPSPPAGKREPQAQRPVELSAATLRHEPWMGSAGQGAVRARGGAPRQPPAQSQPAGAVPALRPRRAKQTTHSGSRTAAGHVCSVTRDPFRPGTPGCAPLPRRIHAQARSPARPEGKRAPGRHKLGGSAGSLGRVRRSSSPSGPHTEQRLRLRPPPGWARSAPVAGCPWLPWGDSRPPQQRMWRLPEQRSRLPPARNAAQSPARGGSRYLAPLAAKDWAGALPPAGAAAARRLRAGFTGWRRAGRSLFRPVPWLQTRILRQEGGGRRSRVRLVGRGGHPRGLASESAAQAPGSGQSQGLHRPRTGSGEGGRGNPSPAGLRRASSLCSPNTAPCAARRIILRCAPRSASGQPGSAAQQPQFRHRPERRGPGTRSPWPRQAGALPALPSYSRAARPGSVLGLLPPAVRAAAMHTPAERHRPAGQPHAGQSKSQALKRGAAVCTGSLRVSSTAATGSILPAARSGGCRLAPGSRGARCSMKLAVQPAASPSRRLLSSGKSDGAAQRSRERQLQPQRAGAERRRAPPTPLIWRRVCEPWKPRPGARWAARQRPRGSG